MVRHIEIGVVVLLGGVELLIPADQIVLVPQEVVGHGGEGAALLRHHVPGQVVVVGIGVHQLLKALLGGSLHTGLRVS